MSIESLALQGKQNINRNMAEAIPSKIFNIRKQIIKECLSGFKNIEHKLEFITNVHGIEFVNDSKSTNINSTWFALKNMTKPVIWIAGGQDKNTDYFMLKDVVKEKVKAIVCIGIDNRKLHNAFADKIKFIANTKSMAEVVSFAYYLGKSGDVVLLSPACASFNLFKDYEDRGRQFKQVVRNL